MTLEFSRHLNILDFDIENRPLSYRFPKPTAEVTVIASCWDNDITSMRVGCLGLDEPEDILKEFVERYNEADIVTGHFIRRHDLPMINGSLMEYGLPLLTPKLTIDTFMDLRKRGDVVSASQENLSQLFGIPAPKVHMTQQDWREANRLLPKGLQKSYDRAYGDVHQHILLRDYMQKHNLLKAPRMWYP